MDQGGFNATAAINFDPSLYVFVDASEESLKEIHRKNNNGIFRDTKIEIISSNIFDYCDQRKFDLVIIEGVIPCQTRPSEMLAHAASFVAENGFLIITTISSISFLSEICRRLFRPLIISRNKTFNEQVSEAEKIFDSHLRSLETKTRSTKDWVLDQILHKWESDAKITFTMIDAINSLGINFDFYNSSPKFLIDDRFYKKIGISAETTSSLCKRQYNKFSLALIDYRINFLDLKKSSQPIDLESLCMKLIDIHNIIIESNSYNRLEDFMFYLSQVRDIISGSSQETADSITDFIENFPRVLEGNTYLQFKEFSKWWGRGQQYVSFIRLK